MSIKTLHFFIVCILTSMNCLSQNNSIYFPQEEIIIAECANTIDKNECLNIKIEKEVFHVLEDLAKKRDNEIDTLKTNITFQLNDLYQIDKERFFSSINDKKLTKKFHKDLKNRILDLNIIRVDNIKPTKYGIKYHFNYHYLQNNQLNKILLDSSMPFKGGVIEEVPLFPNQQRIDNNSDSKTFNSLMQEHIGYHFNYPQEALKKGLQGRVSIIFVIDENGDRTNLRTKGPSPLLENEAIRIISLLPNFQPGLQNGIPTRVPYSIPITFKLQW